MQALNLLDGLSPNLGEFIALLRKRDALLETFEFPTVLIQPPLRGSLLQLRHGKQLLHVHVVGDHNDLHETHVWIIQDVLQTDEGPLSKHRSPYDTNDDLYRTTYIDQQKSSLLSLTRLLLGTSVCSEIHYFHF